MPQSNLQTCTYASLGNTARVPNGFGWDVCSVADVRNEASCIGTRAERHQENNRMKSEHVNGRANSVFLVEEGDPRTGLSFGAQCDSLQEDLVEAKVLITSGDTTVYFFDVH